jgi:hypothetical protein
LITELTVHLDGLLGDMSDPLQSLPRFVIADFAIEPITVTGSTPWGKIAGISYSAKRKFVLDDKGVINPPQVYESVDAMITCFRLFKRGYVAPSLVIGESKPNENQERGAHYFYSGSTARSPQGGMAYSLTKEELPRIENFSNKIAPLISSGKHASLKSPAFRFFNRGIDDMARSEFSMAIIDFVSSMEAVLSPSSAELRHRLSESIALAVEKNLSKRVSIYEKAVELYDLRSRAVHGSMVDNNPDKASDAEKLSRSTIRLLLGYVARSFDKDDIMRDIKMMLLGASKEFPEYAFEFFKQEYVGADFSTNNIGH